jgi:hypothetical protein
MIFWYGFATGLFAGAFLGVILVAILAAGKAQDVEDEKWRQFNAGYKAALKHAAKRKIMAMKEGKQNDPV